jgi:hypothetical protein
MTTQQVIQAAHRENPSHFVARMIRERGFWEDDPIMNLEWLRDEYAEHYGYQLADWTRQCDREAEEAGVLLYARRCRTLRRPMIAVRAHAKACSILVDMDSMQRDREINMGGLSDTESAAIDELMQPYWRELRGSWIIRQWGRVPYERAHELAVSIFKIIMGELPHAA